jgi:hypothetical protein
MDKQVHRIEGFKATCGFDLSKKSLSQRWSLGLAYAVKGLTFRMETRALSPTDLALLECTYIRGHAKLGLRCSKESLTPDLALRCSRGGILLSCILARKFDTLDVKLHRSRVGPRLDVAVSCGVTRSKSEWRGSVEAQYNRDKSAARVVVSTSSVSAAARHKLGKDVSIMFGAQYTFTGSKTTCGAQLHFE